MTAPTTPPPKQPDGVREIVTIAEGMPSRRAGLDAMVGALASFIGNDASRQRRGNVSSQTLIRIRCPECRSRAVYKNGMNGSGSTVRVQYWKCMACEARFKTVIEDAA